MYLICLSLVIIFISELSLVLILYEVNLFEQQELRIDKYCDIIKVVIDLCENGFERFMECVVMSIFFVGDGFER